MSVESPSTPLARASRWGEWMLMLLGSLIMRLGLCSESGKFSCRDKTITSTRLKGASGVRTPGEVEWLVGSESATECLQRYLKYFSFPLVIKPSMSSCGIGVHTNITDAERALSVLRHVSVDHKSILLQEFVHGQEYRLFLLDGKVKEIIRRDVASTDRSPWYVQGDGARSLAELVDEANSQGAHVTINQAHISFYGYHARSVPPKGKWVSVQGVLREASFTRVTVSPKNARFRGICERAIQSMPKSNRIYSMDLIIVSTSEPSAAPEEAPEDIVILEIDAGPLMMESIFSQPCTDWSFWWEVTTTALSALLVNSSSMSIAIGVVASVFIWGGNRIEWASHTPRRLGLGTNTTRSSSNGVSETCVGNASFVPVDSRVDLIPPEYPIIVFLVVSVVWFAMAYYGRRCLRRPPLSFSSDDIMVNTRPPDVILRTREGREQKKKRQKENFNAEKLREEQLKGPFRISEVRPFVERVYFLTTYGSLVLEAYQLCGAAFLPAVGWHASSGSPAWLGWVQSIMAVPYLVLESIPHPSLHKVLYALWPLPECATEAYVWMASSLMVLAFGILVPVALIVVGTALGVLHFCLYAWPRKVCNVLEDLFNGCEGTDEDIEACGLSGACCYKECRLLKRGDVLSDTDVRAVQCPTVFGGFGLIGGPAYAVASLGLGPMALTVMASLFSIYSCSYNYDPPLVTSSVPKSLLQSSPGGVVCWQELHRVFVILGVVIFIPTYLGMLYFNIVQKCQIVPRLRTTFHTKDNDAAKHTLVDVDPLHHCRDLVPKTVTEWKGREGHIESYVGNNKYEWVRSDKDEVQEVDALDMKIRDARFEHVLSFEKSIQIGTVMREVLDSKTEQCCTCCCVRDHGLSDTLKAKVAAQGGVYVHTLNSEQTFEEVRFNPLPQLVSLQLKVFVAALTSFFGRADDWKRFLLLGGLLITNVTLLYVSWHNPTSSNRRLNRFQQMLLSFCVFSTVVGMFARVAGTAALVSWLLGLAVCFIAVPVFACFYRGRLFRGRATSIANPIIELQKATDDTKTRP